MTTLAVKNLIRRQPRKSPTPVTSRDRALYTVDWFLNGKSRMTPRNEMPN